MIIAVFWILRVGLAITLAYAGVDMVIHPSLWVGFMPAWVFAASPLKETPTMVVHGIVHVLIAIGFLNERTIKVSAFLSTLLLVGIILFSGAWFITFRDIGLLAIAIALLLWPTSITEPASHNTLQIGGICLREVMGSIEVLCAQRTLDQVYYPGLWDCGVGRARVDETLEQSAERKISEAFGVTSHAVAPVASYSFFPTGRKVTQGVKYLCMFDRYVNGQGVQLDKKEFSQWKWLPVSQLDGVAWIQGRERSGADDIKSAVAYYRAMVKG